MAEATIRFYAELNDFLPLARRRQDIGVYFDPPCPLRHLVESLGVPHTEIELVLLNGNSVDLEAPVDDGDRIAVYPMFEALDVTPLLRLRPAPLREPRFFADAQLGRLAGYLRLLGFDTLYQNRIGDAALVELANAERRIILTRDRRLLMRRAVTHGCHVRPVKPIEQLAYVVERCDLVRAAHPFTRCMDCNGLLHGVAKQAVWEQLEPATRIHYDAFWQCDHCARIYWKGSHYRALQRLVDTALGRAEQPA
ncbi:MAG: Mut7-C ubiquitin/RNAse domain-containing protein [Chromatiaceae bacterium]|jgi:hypothetical protein|nr:Mut7-C ubiquitin/RNAse domain-containing protein [Chromatiaceae bacterium]